MKTIDTYIFVHDQDIILDFINKKRFSEFKNVKYVFLGNKNIDKLSNLDNIIVARDLPHNIEHYPKLTSFTGWYALYKNNLISSDYVNLFEYDINYKSNFVDKNQQIVDTLPDAVGYLGLTVNSVHFMDPRFTEPLLTKVKEKENIDISSIIQKLKIKNPNLQWTTTSNSTWKREILFKYIEWFSQYIESIGDTPCAGHIAERSISFFYYINKINVQLALNLIEHLQLDSHRTDPNMPAAYNKFAAEYNKIKSNNKLKVISFATGNFIESQTKLQQHLYSIGVSDFIGHTEKDLPTEFIEKFKYLLKYKKGYGYFIWKPWLILQHLSSLENNESLLYVDSTDVPSSLFFEFANSHFNQNDILLINRSYNHGQWTKGDCFALMGCTSEIYFNQTQLEAGVVGFKNTPNNIKLITEWFEYCSNEQIVSDNKNVFANNLPHFMDHRHDQSILTNLAIKYNINSYTVNDNMIRFNANQPAVYG